ncbi:Protein DETOXIFICATION [Melia azedarach]|uniref:Protein DETOXIFICATION n=1 Tax=Melia azedarach TaxID=155640 RepID=A0ACC1YD37_MELAZ|nr:Protein DETOXIFICATION [Melia azedarach]
MGSGLEDRLLELEEHEGGNLRRKIWDETKITWRIAFPSIISRVTSFGIIIVTQSFLGHVSELDLAAFALVQSIFLRFVNGILLGMSSATETLCGQAFGAGHYHMMGIYLQRSWIVDVATAAVMLPVFIFAKPILNLLGQEKDIAEVGGKICLWFIPFVYHLLFSFTIQMYLQAQLKNMIVGWLSTVSFVLHVLLSWIFVTKLGLGIAGAMGALNLSGWLMIVGLFVYIFGGWCPDTWKGFTKAAFVDIFPVIKLSISSGVMLCLELWYNSILVLLAGYMKNATTAIAAFSICLNVSTFELMLFLGFLAAACVRVSNELGKGNAKAARFSVKVILATSTCIGVIFWIICLIFGRQISYLFTNSEEVAEEVSSLSVLLSFSLLLNSVQPVLNGVAVGAGMQGTAAYVNLGSYYVIGVPTGVLLGYVANLGIKGLWIGLLCGVLAQTIILSYIVWRTDWDELVNKASQRLNKWLLKPSEESNGSPPHA